MRSYGTIKHLGEDDRHGFAHKEGMWAIECQAYCMIRLKRIFQRVSKQYGVVMIVDTEETCRELMWFMERFPLEASKEDLRRLKKRSAAFDRAAEEYDKILGCTLAPRSFSLALPLRQYQAIASELALRSKGLLLADQVGLGKTACAIGMLTEPFTRPALVVTLTHLPWQWEAEIKKFAPALKTHILKKGSPYDLRPKKAGSYDPDFPDVIISNYHKLSGWADTLSGVVNTVIYDEVQELRKNTSDKYHAARHISDAADFRIGLSATPIYNYGGEFYNVIDCLRPDVLGSKEEFLREWCSGANRDFDKSTIRDPKAFGVYLREHALMLRRTRKEVGRELPPIQTMVMDIDCDEAALADVKSDAMSLARTLLAQDTEWKTRGMAAREFDMKLRQATGIAKAPYVADFVRLLVEAGEPVVLYGWHRAVYDIWMERLKDLDPVLYTGSESPVQKEASRKAFVEGRSKILIMSLRSGAGLEGLQERSHVVVKGELDWSPGVHVQCIGRVHRDGQDEPTMVYYLLAREGADHTIADVLGIKRQQLEAVVDPDAALVENLQIDENHVKRLAEDYLKRHVGT